MGAGQSVLAATHMQQALPKIQLLAPQTDQFRDASPVPVGEQDHRGVAVALAPSRCAAAISRSISTAPWEGGSLHQLSRE